MDRFDAKKYWSMPSAAVLQNLNSTSTGLTKEEAASRLKEYGTNSIKGQEKTAPIMLFLNQFKSLIILIMIIATAISAATGDWIDSLIIFAIVLASVVLSFLQEYKANNVIEELRSRIQNKSTVIRDSKTEEIPTTMLVPGDIVMLSTGSLIPADGLILKCDSFYVNQSVLTGESFAIEKEAEAVQEDAALTERRNCVFMGTNVRSGSAMVLVIKTGRSTEYGQIAKELTKKSPETEFGRGVRHFGYFLAVIMLFLTVIVFVINMIMKKLFTDSLLFSVALAVGITPQLLPAIINITISKGSKSMAQEGVIVRHLTALENFGSMDVLCTDKTGTLTEGTVHMDKTLDARGEASETVFRLAYLNAKLQTGMVNELDEAIIVSHTLDISAFHKLSEIPFDFDRMRLGIVVQEDSKTQLTVKGALNSVLSICDKIQIDSKELTLDTAILDSIHQRLSDLSNQGFHVIGIAQKSVNAKDRCTVKDEQGMTFMGFLLFLDPPKADIIQTVTDLSNYGVQLKIITGDNKLVAMHTADMIGLIIRNVLTGDELTKLSDEALMDIIETVDLFAEVNPSQKERIVLVLKKKNHVVGYMGDGINDAPALHAADVSISVNTAVDVAKETADFVLQEKSLNVLKRGIELGRAIFANTIKYIYITTSANFGNMFSMAGASLFLPFLPLLPKQILLINFITDLPAMTITGDSVDPEMINIPHRWDMKLIRNFMLTFGLISSIFDYMSFAVLLVVFKAPEQLFQSGWFVLSVLTELLILMIARTKKPFYKSKPAPMLLYSTIAVGIFTLILPYLPLKSIFSITPIPPLVLLTLLGIAVLYIVVTEIAKFFFYRSRKN